MNRPMQELRYFFTALGYFTRVPVPRWVGFEPEYLHAASRYFPLIGVLAGVVNALVYCVALRAFPAGVAVILSMAAGLIFTGALHEDGLADCADAFGGAFTREDALRIMRDSRIGAFGAIALIVVLVLKWQTLAALPPVRCAALIVAAHSVSRVFAISYLCTLEYVREEGKAKPVARRMGAGAMLFAATVGLPWIFWPDWRLGCVVIVAMLLCRYLLGRYFVKRLGGYTGDCLGMAQQVFEVTIYLIGLAWISF